jgi:hypothetical protein
MIEAFEAGIKTFLLQCNILELPLIKHGCTGGRKSPVALGETALALLYNCALHKIGAFRG